MPSEEELAGVAVQPTGSVTPPVSSTQTLGLGEAGWSSGDQAAKVGPLVPTGAGLPALPKKLILKIRANEYIDFADLPPAKGKMRAIPQGLEGQVIVVQAEHLQTKKLIPDLSTWMQCFAEP